MIDMFAKAVSHLSAYLVDGAPTWHDGDIFDCCRCEPQRCQADEEAKRLMRFDLRNRKLEAALPHTAPNARQEG